MYLLMLKNDSDSIASRKIDYFCINKNLPPKYENKLKIGC